MSEFDYTHFHLFKTDNLLELKQGLDDYLNSIPYGSKILFFDEIELHIIPVINISIDTKENGLNFLIPMNDWEIGYAKEKIKFLERYVAERRKYFLSRKSLSESKLDIINALLFDTNFVLELINNQIKFRDYKKYIISSNRTLFDNLGLQSYLSTLTITTPYLQNRIKEILLRIDKIIDFDNGIMKEINEETDRKEIWNTIDFGDNSFISMAYNYECFIIEDNKKSRINLYTEKNRFYFQSNHEYDIFENRDFAVKSAVILNTLTGYLNISTLEEMNLFLYGKKESGLEISDSETTEYGISVSSGTDEGGSESIINPYPQIFINRKAYLLFERWHSNYKNTRTLLADYSFIYRQMSKDKLILDTYKSEMFRQWISQEPYNIYLDAKLKTFDRCSTLGKINLYNSLKRL